MNMTLEARAEYKTSTKLGLQTGWAVRAATATMACTAAVARTATATTIACLLSYRALKDESLTNAEISEGIPPLKSL